MIAKARRSLYELLACGAFAFDLCLIENRFAVVEAVHGSRTAKAAGGPGEVHADVMMQWVAGLGC